MTDYKIPSNHQQQILWLWEMSAVRWTIGCRLQSLSQGSENYHCYCRDKFWIGIV